MKNPKLVDKITIGTVEFAAYIVDDENNLEAFAIYYQHEKEPLLMFQQIGNGDNEVEIKINKEMVEKLQLLKSKDLQQRKAHYIAFREFALNAEQKAKEIALKDKKLYYLTDVQLIKCLEQAYLVD